MIVAYDLLFVAIIRVMVVKRVLHVKLVAEIAMAPPTRWAVFYFLMIQTLTVLLWLDQMKLEKHSELHLCLIQNN